MTELESATMQVVSKYFGTGDKSGGWVGSSIFVRDIEAVFNEAHEKKKIRLNEEMVRKQFEALCARGFLKVQYLGWKGCESYRVTHVSKKGVLGNGSVKEYDSPVQALKETESY